MRADLMSPVVEGAKTALTLPGFDKVSNSRVLVVGAGGIGCELLKNLVLTGFKNIALVDMDTIEVSNLNRQFLFTRADVGRPKAQVAAAAAASLAPCSVVITPHVANIKSFNVGFFARFDVILSALDNLEARRVVNRGAVLAGVPVVESGTAGYSGQCSVWREGIECFDCRPHPTPTVYPVCTIRATPTQFIHCIVWAKEYLLPKLFGRQEHSLDNLEGVEESIAESLREEAGAFGRIQLLKGSDGFGAEVFRKVFVRDIEKLLAMEELWVDRPTRPVPLTLPETSSASFDYSSSTEQLREWPVNRWTDCFFAATTALAKRAGPVPFDKDDIGVMAFVAAAAVLRATAFQITGIPSLFKAKEMAGNIVPAIAATNAIAAALVTIQAVNLILSSESNYAKACLKTVYVTHGGAKRILSFENLEEGCAECPVCNTTRLWLDCSVASTTIVAVVEAVKKAIGCVDDEEVSVLVGERLVYDSIDMDADRPLSSLGVKDGETVTMIIGDRRPVLVWLRDAVGLAVIVKNVAKPVPGEAGKDQDEAVGDRGQTNKKRGASVFDSDQDAAVAKAVKFDSDEEDLVIL